MSDFATLHRAGDPLILPNVWDVASARCLVEAGFPALGTTSLGVAAAGGLPDGAGAAGAETLRLTRSLAKLPVHLTVDLETGSIDAAVAVAAAGAGPDGVFVPGLAEPADIAAEWQPSTYRSTSCSCPAGIPSLSCRTSGCGGSAPARCSSAPPWPHASTQP